MEFVSPSVIRASVVLFSVTYSYAVVAHALFCATPMGQQPIDTIKDDSMVKRWASGVSVGMGHLFRRFQSIVWL